MSWLSCVKPVQRAAQSGSAWFYSDNRSSGCRFFYGRFISVWRVIAD
uniref:Uncharacterized protein n=1 Tax=Curvibacter symbiont subsp. Hydra magnipapillata TaxID=667019 RepID=C9YEJ6_CURXX|nr:hypothetical protein Csp_D30020 [Curvibacter putative symbiont of Hydra magnipapillata]